MAYVPTIVGSAAPVGLTARAGQIYVDLVGGVSYVNLDGSTTWQEIGAGGGGGQTLYDIVVDAGGGGDYTSIATAFATEGSNKSYFITQGVYTETTMTVPSGTGTSVHWQNPLITLTSSAQLVAGDDSSVMSGKATFTGSGDSTGKFLYVGNTDYLDWGSCHLIFIPTISSINTTYILAMLGGRYSSFKIEIQGKAIDLHPTGTRNNMLGVCIWPTNQLLCAGSTYDITVSGFEISGIDSYAWCVYINGAYAARFNLNLYHAPGSNFTDGFSCQANCDYCYFSGVNVGNGGYNNAGFGNVFDIVSH